MYFCTKKLFHPLMIKTFYFNDLRTCCYVLYDGTGECAIVDPGCYTETEKTRLTGFIEDNHLTPKMILLTHGHFDHVMGCAFVSSRWNIPTYMNRKDISQIARATSYGTYFGYTFDAPDQEPADISEGDIISFGRTSLEARLSPGHSPGGVVYYNAEEHYALTGDSLFAGSIGRTDLPGGDLDLLMNSLKERILTLPPDTTVCPGHGQSTTIGHEINTNPFLEHLF